MSKAYPDHTAPKIGCIGQHPFAGTCNSFTLPVYEALAVDFRVGQKDTLPASVFTGFATSDVSPCAPKIVVHVSVHVSKLPSST